jgi:glycosyltransferase involved in cell wall biosynthesis
MTNIGSLSVVVPVFNEEDILEDTVEELLAGLAKLSVERFELILCENGSTDTTREIAYSMVAAHPYVRLLTLDRADYGAAQRAGLLAAQGEVVVSFDADYYDLDFLQGALAAAGDVVVASKGISGSDDRRSLLRRLASSSFGLLTRSLLGIKVRETHGMKLFRARALGLVPFVAATKDLFDTELLAVAELGGLAIDELPITTEEKRPSRSGILSRIPRTILGLLEIRARLRAEFVPEPGTVSASPTPVLDAA